MSEDSMPRQPPEAADPAPAERRRGSTWIVVGLLVLLGGWFVVTQVISHTGPPVQWIHNDLQKAQRAAQDSGRRIFLLLYEPGCKVTQANERDLFSLRRVRQLLDRMVCCRIELRPGDPLRRRFKFQGTPLMLVLEPGRERPLNRLEGKVDWLQFRTYVDPGLTDEAG